MVNLNIYRFELLNKAKEQQVLSFYNEQEDLLDTMDDFCGYIHRNIKNYTDIQGKHRTFSLANIQEKDSDKRIITGYIDSAYTGEKGKVKYGNSNQIKCDIEKCDLNSKDFFYLIHVPKKSKFGFLIFQKKENHGVKQVFENTFNGFMKSKGVSNYYLELKQAPPRYFIRNFLEHGKLKEFRLIDGSFGDDADSKSISFGKEERIFKQKGNSSDGKGLKEILVTLFNSFASSSERIPFLDKGEFDEIVFVLGINGSSKTFYIRNQEKIRSNVDVSSLIEYNDGEPTFESLIKISLEIIKQAS